MRPYSETKHQVQTRSGSNLKYVHFMHPTKNAPAYGILEGENVAVCEGEIFREPIKKDEVVSLSEIREYLPVVFSSQHLGFGAKLLLTCR